MINISKKSDIVIPFSKIGDKEWLEKTKSIATSLLVCWGTSYEEIEFDLKSDEELDELEKSVGASLPYGLRVFYQTFGVSDVGDKLQEFDLIGRLNDTWDLDAKLYCGPDFSPEELQLFPHLVTFSEHPGTGNMFCFHDITHEIYYVDHKKSPYISKMFDSVDEFFTACAIVCQIDLFDLEIGQEKVETWIRELMTEHFGEKVLEKWNL